MDKHEFEKLVEEAIDNLPGQIQEKLDNVAVVIEDSPSAEQLKKSRLKAGHTLFGLYEGVPRTKRGPGYTGVLPDKISIFQKPIERAASTPEGIKKQVTQTVWHEISHHFGFDEPGARKLDQKRD